MSKGLSTFSISIKYFSKAFRMPISTIWLPHLEKIMGAPLWSANANIKPLEPSFTSPDNSYIFSKSSGGTEMFVNCLGLCFPSHYVTLLIRKCLAF